MEDPVITNLEQPLNQAQKQNLTPLKLDSKGFVLAVRARAYNKWTWSIDELPKELGEMKVGLTADTFYVNEMLELKDCNEILQQDVIETGKFKY